MTGVDPNTKYEKIPTGCRGFLLPILSHLQNKHNAPKI